jgi:hypothetical protein
VSPPSVERKLAALFAAAAQDRRAERRNRLRQAGLRFRHFLGWPRRWWKGGDHSRRTANATALLAFGTLLLAGVNVFMLIEMRREAKQQHIDTIAAITKTDQTVAALTDQSKTMRGQLDEMRIDRRPSIEASIEIASGVWLRITRAIEALQAPANGPPN